MFVRIGCTDGNTYASDEVSETELQEYLDSVSGNIGTGELTDFTVDTVDDLVEFLQAGILGETVNDITFTSFNMEINGQKRVFSPNHVVWHEIVRD